MPLGNILMKRKHQMMKTDVIQLHGTAPDSYMVTASQLQGNQHNSRLAPGCSATGGGNRVGSTARISP